MTNANNRITSTRIITQNRIVSNDTWKTKLNNNDLIIGPSGSGKTRNYVQPNILQTEDSIIITDTKGTLIKTYGKYLSRKGYHVYHLDLTNPEGSCTGYNPLSYIHFDKDIGTYSQTDIKTISHSIIQSTCDHDAYWIDAARNLLQCLIAYTMEALPKEEQTLETVGELFELYKESSGSPVAKGINPLDVGFFDKPAENSLDRRMSELAETNPASVAVRLYRYVSTIKASEKTDACIQSFLSNALAEFTYVGCNKFYQNPNSVNFKDIGKTKSAIFLTVSDNNRSQDQLVNLFYTQALQSLLECADEQEDGRLPVPVRMILDDFATNTVIPNFDNIISVIRSRDIYVSIVLQSLTQLDALYGQSRALTILNNCDHCLYLGGQDLQTINYISQRADKTVSSIMNLGIDDVVLLERASPALFDKKYDIESHPFYQTLFDTIDNETSAEQTTSSQSTSFDPSID